MIKILFRQMSTTQIISAMTTTLCLLIDSIVIGRLVGVDAKTAMLIGLCVEEMTVNIIEHGFTKDKLSHNVDVRLVLVEDKRIIRIRDNCVNFDPTNYLELHQSSDPTAHIGLRMVMAMVKEANYVNTLGLNNLTLIL